MLLTGIVITFVTSPAREDTLAVCIHDPEPRPAASHAEHMQTFRRRCLHKDVLIGAREAVSYSVLRDGGLREYGSDAIKFVLAYWLAALASLILLVLTGLLLPLDHDEGQYVAAAWLVHRSLLPFIDFPYLQTPLQPFLLAPAAGLVPGWIWVSSRFVNAVAVTIGLLFLGRAASRLAGDDRAAPVVILVALACDSLLPEVLPETMRYRSCSSPQRWKGSTRAMEELVRADCAWPGCVRVSPHRRRSATRCQRRPSGGRAYGGCCEEVRQSLAWRFSQGFASGACRSS